MTNWHKLSRFAVLTQTALWAILLIIFLVVLPRQGFAGWEDFNDPAKIAAAPWAMAFLVWSDVGFGLTMLISVSVLHQYLRTRMPLIVRGTVTIVLVGVVGWFIAHDIGFHVIGWPAIELDPASTNYTMDRVLWAIRNGVFFAATLLIALTTASANQPKPSISRDPLTCSE